MSMRANDGGGSLLNIILSGMATQERERENTDPLNKPVQAPVTVPGFTKNLPSYPTA